MNFRDEITFYKQTLDRVKGNIFFLEEELKHAGMFNRRAMLIRLKALTIELKRTEKKLKTLQWQASH